MEIKYRLKKDARQFFEKKQISTDIYTLSKWKDVHGIPEELLEEVPRVHVSYGHERIGSTGVRSSHLGGWRSDEQMAYFQFTVWVNDVSNTDYSSIKQDEMMDEIQKVLDRYFKHR